MTNEVKNVPELRFPGFEDEWKEKKLGTIFTVTMGQSPNSTNYTDNPNDTILVQGNADIYKGKIWPRIYTKEITKLLERNDIILSVRAPVGEIGIAQVEACIGRGVCSIKGNKFLYYFLDLFKKQNRWSRFSQGSTFESISGKDIRDLKFYVCNSEEQNKIGKFFNKLDRQIELEEQKLEKLEEQKKGYMQKIFSQELRFKDENGQEYPAWINKKLGDIGKVSMNKRIYKNETSINGEIPFYKIGTFGKEAETFISREKFEEYKNKYPYPEKGDILISASGSIGRTIEYDGEEAYYQDSNIVWLDHNDEVLNIFLKYIYSVIKWSGIEGTTIKRLYNKDILNTKIDLPVIKEQEKIGNFFGKIDDSIEKQSSKIGVLKQRKKGFLQKMFV
ncbi:restriction endonuclease subunit S [Staphylococcus succinus]|uniref:restriction endonuclease subunit S n=1 Tax=Staphylococcus succinus TaxID=61015 RepID=UPI000E680E25|nr:restriction endonuclease subunit S [Staphylococcus succinus]RIN39909.1 restriction endonuclease subunit S [Staphylococcus succinus]